MIGQVEALETHLQSPFLRSAQLKGPLQGCIDFNHAIRTQNIAS